MMNSQISSTQYLHCGRNFSVFLFLFSLASPSFAADEPLTIYTELSFSDSVIEEGDGEPTVTGFATDFVRAVVAEAGLEAKIELVPWPRLLQFVQNQPNTLAYGMARNPSREDRYHWIGQTRPMTFKLWGLKDREQELPHSLDEARNSHVSATRGDVVTEYLIGKNFSNLVYTRSSSNTYPMLSRERIDLIPYSSFGIRQYMQHNDIPEGTLVDVIELDEISTGNFLVMNKLSDPNLVEALTKAFQILIDNGEYERIMGSSLD